MKLSKGHSSFGVSVVVVQTVYLHENPRSNYDRSKHYYFLNSAPGKLHYLQFKFIINYNKSKPYIQIDTHK